MKAKIASRYGRTKPPPRRVMAERADPPKWAPPEVTAQLKGFRDLATHYPANDPRRDCPDMLYRLLTHEDMKAVWAALRLSKKLLPSPAIVFATSACHGFCGPHGEAGKTPAEHRKFLEDVQKRSAALAELLRNTELDKRLIQRLEVEHQEVGRAVWRHFSEMLDSVASGARYYAAASAAKRTHGKDARRAYFIQYLTAFFREYLGGPRRELVAITVRAAFDDPGFDVRKVYALAP